MTDTSLNAFDMDIYRTEDLLDSWRHSPRGWGHSRHSLSPYVGGFPPSLAKYFIEWFSNERDTVLDPFCGGGTVPLEASLNNRNAFGNDALDYATVVSKAKVTPISTTTLKNRIVDIKNRANDITNSNMELLDDEGVKAYFSDYTLNQILRWKHVIRNKEYDDVDNYIDALMCGVLHGPSDMFLSVSTKDTYASSPNGIRNVVENKELEYPRRDVYQSILRKHELVTKNDFNESNTSILTGDARSLDIPSNNVDLVVTSPPYLRVLDYTWNNWIRLWWLGNDRNRQRDNLDLTSSVDKYRTFINQILQELKRVIVDSGIIVLVVGDVKKELTNTSRIVITANLIAEEARKVDLYPHTIINDDYGVDGRSYGLFNKIKYDYDTNKDIPTPIDRCVVLTSTECDDLPDEPEINWNIERYTGQKSILDWS